MKVSSFINSISVVSRSKDWRLSFVPFTLGCVYFWLSLYKIDFSIHHLSLFLLALCTTIGFASLGYFINEFFDQEEDKRASKINKLSLISSGKKLLLFFVIMTITFFPWFYLPADNYSYALIGLEVSLFLIYSLPIIRGKNRTYLAGTIDSLYAYLIPSLLSFHTFYLVGNSSSSWYGIFVFFILLFFVGYRNIFIHQIKDVLNDQRSGLKTLPQALGPESSSLLLRVIYLVELSLVVASSVIFFFIWKVYLIYFFSLILYLYLGRKQLIKVFIKEPFFTLKSSRSFMDQFYQLWFPLIHLLLLVFLDWKWVLLLPIHILLFVNKDYVIAFWQNMKEYFWHRSVKPATSFIVNHFLYLSFLLIGVDLIKENKSAIEFLKSKWKN